MTSLVRGARRRTIARRKPRFMSTLSWLATTMPPLIRSVRMIQGMINVEKKYIVSNGTLSSTLGGNVACLNILDTGDTDVTRNGDSILAKYINIKLSFTHDLDLDSTSACRVLLVVDKENRGALPANSDILSDPSTGNFPLALRNLANNDRFVVLRDFTVQMRENINGHAETKYGGIFKKLNFHMKYDGSAGDVTDVRQNSIFLMVSSDSSTDPIAVTYNSYLTFYDN